MDPRYVKRHAPWVEKCLLEIGMTAYSEALEGGCSHQEAMQYVIDQREKAFHNLWFLAEHFNVTAGRDPNPNDVPITLS